MSGRRDVHSISSSNVRSILLSRFDYQTVTKSLGVWNGTSKIPEKMERFLRKYTLVDELPRQGRIGQRVEIKLNIFSTSKIIVLTSSFNVYNPNQGEPVICSLCIVFEYEIAPKIFENYKVITNHVERLSKLYKSIHSKIECESEGVKSFSQGIVTFVQVFNTLCNCGLAEFTINETVLLDIHRKDMTKFFSVAVTSHLRTHGYSVIVGRDKTEVDFWVNTMSLFLLPKERKRCRHAIHGMNYVPELFVQGVIMGERCKNWKDVVPMRNILFGSFPVTIIDLSTKRVLCFQKFNFFVLVKKNFQYLYDNELGDTKGILKSKHIQETKTTVPCVEKMFRCLLTIPSRYREGYICEWIRLLNRKALSFAKLISEFQNVNEVNVDEILRMIDVNKADKLILLAAAEKIKPGIYTKVLGNLSEEVETVIDFLENL